MCLAIPGRVVALDASNQTACVDYEGLQKNASTRLFADLQIGQYVLVHAGFVIQVLSEEEGAELSLLAEEVGFYDNEAE